MSARHALLWVAAAAALAAGCGRARLPGPDSVASLGDREIAYARFEEYLKANAVETDVALDSVVLSALFDQFLDEELVLLLAVDRGLVPEDAGAEEAVAALAARRPDGAIAEGEIARFYDEHGELFERPEQVRLSQILVNERETAERARAELAAGAPFADVARRHSQEPSAARGGDQGWLERQDLPPDFVDVVFGLAVGEVSDPVAADYGFHIFYVTARRPAARTPLEAAAPGIRDRLERERSAQRLAQLVAEARDRYTPRVYGRNLPFRYSGKYAT